MTAFPIKVPRLGWSMEEGTFVEWLKRDGDQVQAGDLLFSIEGDKAIQEIESIDSGTLRIPADAPQPGETVQVGAVLGYLDGDGTATDDPPVEPDDVTARFAETPQASAPTAPRRHRTSTAISPRAARVARELGIEVHGISGTGADGRIRERDVRATIAATSRPAGGAAPMSSLRKTIAARMAESARSAAAVTLTTTADATNLVSLRAQFKRAGADPSPSYGDLIAKLVARVLVDHPALNSQWTEAGIVQPEGVHIAFAVDTPAGLVTPVISNIGALGLKDLAARSADLRERAVQSRLKPAELQGGTFTITNLGAFGIDAFTPIINPPQCAILGLGRIDRRPHVVGDQVVPREMITLSLTFDHRIVDGAPAAQFLAGVRTAIENPGPWLVF